MATIKLTAAQGQPLYQFVPLKTFNAVVEGSENCYIGGETYTVREGNKDLHRLVRQWNEENKVLL